MWDDVEVQNDRAMAAREQGLACRLRVERSPDYEQHIRENKKHKCVSFDIERGSRASIDRKRARHEPVDRKRGGRVSLDRPQEHPAFIDYERERHAFVDHERHRVDREQQRRESVDRERERGVSIDRRHDRDRDMSIGRHGQYEYVSRMFPRPTVCAASFEPPATGSESRPRKSESVMVPRPPVSAVSFKPPTTGPQSCHFRSSSFDYATGYDYSGERQHHVYVLSPSAPAPQMHVPPRRRDRTASVEAVRRLPFLSPKVPPFEKSKPSGLTRFNPFNRLRSATISASQKIRGKTAGRA